MFFICIEAWKDALLNQGQEVSVRINGSARTLSRQGNALVYSDDHHEHRCEIISRVPLANGDIDYTCMSHGQKRADVFLIDPLDVLVKQFIREGEVR